MADYAELFWSFPARLRNLLETCYNREWKAWEGHAHINLLWSLVQKCFEAFSRSWAFDAKRTFTSSTVLTFIVHWKHRWRLFRIFFVQFWFPLIKGPQVYIFEYLITLNIKSWKKSIQSMKLLLLALPNSSIRSHQSSSVMSPSHTAPESHQNLITSLLILLWLVLGKARISRESFPFPNVIDARLRFLISNSDIFPSNLDSTLLRCEIFRYALKCRNEFISKTKLCKLEWHGFEAEFHPISFISSEPECAKILEEKFYQMGKSAFFGDFNPASFDYMLQTSRTHAQWWLDIPTK